ncbi:GlxA family transcriptional regulator [Metapseudomonas lalkuanensis]|uniref:GlxA family transcriptional regulator n=1 Tax=Metapseudomonas lalkuanensis TaxID=2604832 RepID=A0A5J6QQS4_9GAMM|nr:GlxA family transcriptional regulator [Pseudomonas lalkuanensis]QEY63029.1 GlxA family transcriptional regulator [Pseudomonas lalkuanensis]
MKKIIVGLLVFPGFQLLDIAGPKDAFAQVKVLSQGACEYEMLTIGTTRSPLLSSSGLTVIPDRTIFDPCPNLDTVIVPGGLGIFDVYSDSVLCDWLKEQSRSCRRLAAICNGVFALGAAGLIDHKSVTTHWMDAAHLSELFPSARVDPDHIHVKDGIIYTTAGVTAGIDLSLLMIEEDFGKRMAIDVAKYLVVYLRRAGGQSQFSPMLEMQGNVGTQVQAVQEFVLENLHLDHTLVSLAERVHMSPRNLTRLFAKETGVPPMSFLADARIDAARRHLEATEQSIKEIAYKCGFDGADSLRRVFVKRLSISPVEYRQRFRTGGSSIET